MPTYKQARDIVNREGIGEENFQKGVRNTAWYNQYVAKYGEEPDLDTTDYNTRAAWQAGVRPNSLHKPTGMYHWSSGIPETGEWLKNPYTHPTAWMQSFMEKYGYDPEEKGITYQDYLDMERQ
jgi:hypothetical protein